MRHPSPTGGLARKSNSFSARTTFPSHQPAVLLRLVVAFDAVRSGKITPTPDSPGKVLYKVDDISFLMRPDSR